MIKSDRNYTIINDRLLSNTTYRICMRCRQENNDPYDAEECREIRTPSKFSKILQ
jgi:ribosomal protein L40E